MKKQDLVKLKKYMHQADRKEFLSKIKDDSVSFEECKAYADNAITHRQISGGWSYSQAEDMEYQEYIHELSEEDQIWIKKFYHEMYANRLGFPEDYRILTTEELMKESNRINNMRNRDLYNVKRNRGQIELLDDYEILTRKDDKTEYDDMIAILEKFGYEEAVQFAIDGSIEELDQSHLDKRLTMVRFYVKLNMLKKEVGHQNFFKILKEYKDER